MSRHLERIESEKLELIERNGFIFDPRSLSFRDRAGSLVSIEDVEDHDAGWLVAQIEGMQR
jgi:hypothetical protein